MDTPPLPAKKSSSGFWITITLLVLALLVSVGFNLILSLSMAWNSWTWTDEGGGEDEFPVMEETWSYGSGDAKVVRIAVEGVILREMESDGFFEQTADKITGILHQIRAAKNDEDVRAIILEVDSPGGGITESDEIYAELLSFKSSAEGRKVVVFMRDLAASGGYYVAMAGDWLIAQPTTVVGSIGVIMQTINFKGLGEKLGIKDTTIKSGENKDLLNPFIDVPPEQMALLQGVVDNMYGHFFDIVKEARGIEEATLKPLADGRIFVSKDALDLGLVDQIGYWEDAVAKTAEVLGERAVKVVRFEKHDEFLSLLSLLQTPVGMSRITEAMRPRLMYLWKP